MRLVSIAIVVGGLFGSGAVEGRSTDLAELGLDGPQDGPFELADTDGVVLVEGAHLEGRRDGRWRWRWPDGKKRVLGRYRDGLAHGPWRYHYEDGELQAKGAFERGRRAGEWSVHHPDGSQDELESGTYGWSELFAEDGGLRAEGPTLDGARHGRWRFFWPDGSLRLEAEFVRREPAGAWRFRHVDGSVDPGMYPGERRAPSPLHALDDFVVERVEGEGPDAPDVSGVPGSPDAPESQGATGAAVAASGVASTGDAAAPAAIEAVALAPWLAPTSTPPAELAAWFQELETGDEATRLAAAERIRGLGLQGARFVLERIVSAPLDGEGHVAQTSWLHYAARLLANGHAPAWPMEDGAEAARGRRLAILRLQAMWTSIFESETVQSLDLAIAPIRAEASNAMALAPPLPTSSAPSPDGAKASRRRRSKDRDRDEAVDLALGWLVEHQAPTGAWKPDAFGNVCETAPAGACDGLGSPSKDVGVTALALLVFLSTGNTPDEGPWSHVVRRGFGWLLAQQDPTTGCMPRSTHDFHYDQAIATLAFSRAAAVCESSALRLAAERGVAYIHSARNPKSAWRYDQPPTGESDTSITAWMIRALVAAQRLGIETDPQAFSSTIVFLGDMTSVENGHVGYDARGVLSARTKTNKVYPAEAGEAMTAAGLLTRFLCGQQPDAFPVMKRSADLILRKLPAWDPDELGHDMYFWFNASDALVRYGGKHGRSWSKALDKVLLGSQRKDGHARGSWDPIGPWGYVGGRTYATSLCALALLAEERLEQSL